MHDLRCLAPIGLDVSAFGAIRKTMPKRHPKSEIQNIEGGSDLSKLCTTLDEVLNPLSLLIFR